MARMPSSPPSEVKGSWFISARRVITSEQPESLSELLRHIDPPYRDAISDPLASHWYPEAALQQLFAAMHRVMAEGDRDTFGRLMERTTEAGIRHFFRFLVRLSTPSFVLRQVPTIWKQIRRGPGKVVVDIEEKQATIRYSEFPYFADPLYRAFTKASLRALMRICTSRDADVRIADQGSDWLTLTIVYARPSSRPAPPLMD